MERATIDAVDGIVVRGGPVLVSIPEITVLSTSADPLLKSLFTSSPPASDLKFSELRRDSRGALPRKFRLPHWVGTLLLE